MDQAIEDLAFSENEHLGSEDYFAEIGRSDFASQYRSLNSAARASLAAKAKELELALDSLFDESEFGSELAD